MRLKLIFFPEENFLIISYKVDEVVVVLPSSITSTSLISLINIKSKSVAVILSFELYASNKMLDNILEPILKDISDAFQKSGSNSVQGFNQIISNIVKRKKNEY